MKKVNFPFVLNYAIVVILMCFSSLSTKAQSCNVQDSLQLVSLYNSTNGANWTNKWILNNPVRTWHGVTLYNIYDNIHIGRVKQLNQSGNNLQGTIPNLNLPNLTSLSLGNNQLSGTIPNFNLPALTWLTLSNNRLTSVPNFNIARSLQLLSLGYNQLTSVPNFNLISLHYLFLSGNQLSSVPNFSNLPYLTDLSLTHNRLTSIPNFNLVPNLKVLSIQRNLLTSVPNFNLLPNLKSLHLSSNQLTNIPSFNLPNLEHLSIDDNRLSNLPNMSLSNNVSYVTIHNNNLNFNIQNWNYFNRIGSYAPQNTILPLTQNNGILIANLAGMQNASLLTYKWYNNGNLVATIQGNSQYTPTQNGTYTYKVSHATITQTGVAGKDLVLNSAPLVFTAPLSCAAGDRAILMNLYNTTGGANWTNRTNWGSTQPLNTWYGIQTNADGCVIGIDLDGIPNWLPVGSWNTGNNLVGTIPSNLTSLRNLQYLSLAHNRLSGTIPANLGSLNNLTHLCLAENQLTGTIPTSLGGLPLLQALILSQNQLTGSIPTSLGNLSNLLYLYLGNNQLSGSLPSQLGNLSKLIVMYIAQNQLTGAIPTTWGPFPRLSEIWLRNNQLSGTIPTNFGTFTKLTFLILNNNQLTGQIPPSFGNLREMRYLSLSNNLLVGMIPTGFSNMAHLIELGLSYNQLTCSATNPLTMFNGLGNLTKLYLQDNRLTGMIPNFNLPALKYLTLTRNQLTGVIPNFSGMPLLQQLYLSWNQLTGAIPNFNNFPVLEKLALHQNQLSGSVPNFAVSNLSTLPVLKELYLHNNNTLTGSIPDFKLPQLTALWLQNNNFSGCIPSTLRTNCPSITSGNISNNPLLLTQDWNAYYIGQAGQCSLSRVEPTNAEARSIDRTVELTWQTASEKSNDRFDVERSIDGKTFLKIGEVKGHGTTNKTYNYEFTDNAPFLGIGYYRLRQVDTDRQVEYSKTVSVEMRRSDNKMSVFPNPVSNNLTVVFDKKLSDTEGGSSQLELYNLQGQLLKQQPLETGLDETKVSMQQLPAGVYMISLRQNGQIISSEKVTKN